MRKPTYYGRKLRQFKHFSDTLNRQLQDGSFFRLATEARQKLIRRLRGFLAQLKGAVQGSVLKKSLAGAALLLGFGVNTQAQQFLPPVENPFGFVETTGYAIPTQGDLDGDGDYDLMVGDYDGNLNYFRNTGSKTNPAFAAVQQNPFGLVKVGTTSFPRFVDLDDDGDLDLMVGTQNSGGELRYFENTGSATNPAFAAPQTNPFGLDTSYVFAAPAICDLDNDGDFDILVGTYWGIKYFENLGTASNPDFTDVVDVYDPHGLSFNGTVFFPEAGDFDRDGDFDLIMGTYLGDLIYFENTGDAANPAFAAGVTNPFGLSRRDALAFPGAVNLDNDGDLDLMVGEYYGDLHYFEDTTGPPVGLSAAELHAEISLSPNPAQEKLQIDLEFYAPAEDLDFAILDLQGRIVEAWQEANITRAYKKSVEVTTLPPGAYLLRIKSSEGMLTRKFLKD